MTGYFLSSFQFVFHLWGNHDDLRVWLAILNTHDSRTVLCAHLDLACHHRVYLQSFKQVFSRIHYALHIVLPLDAENDFIHLFAGPIHQQDSGYSNISSTC